MIEKIIPEKELLFQPKQKEKQPEKQPLKIQPPVKPVKKQVPKIEQTPQEVKPQFNIPQPISPNQKLTTQQIQQVQPEKKNGWKKWVIGFAIFLIVVSLGIYFLVL